MPEWVKWEHVITYDTTSSKNTTVAKPGFLMEVGQGKYCKTHIVGTAKWHYSQWPIWHDCTANNIYNQVVYWAHP